MSSDLEDFLCPLPDVGEPLWVAPGVVQVGDYTFDDETIADAALDEARYVAAILVAKKFLDENRVADRKQRLMKAAIIAYEQFDTEYPMPGGRIDITMRVESPFYKIAEAILTAVDDGEL